MSRTTSVSAFLFLIIACPLPVEIMVSQQASPHRNITFCHLTTAQGLSDNCVTDMSMDKTGNLWIGTLDGLKMFNGKSVSWFLRENYPQIVLR